MGEGEGYLVRAFLMALLEQSLWLIYNWSKGRGTASPKNIKKRQTCRQFCCFRSLIVPQREVPGSWSVRAALTTRAQQSMDSCQTQQPREPLYLDGS